jgi:hypothetical protein
MFKSELMRWHPCPPAALQPWGHVGHATLVTLSPLPPCIPVHPCSYCSPVTLQPCNPSLWHPQDHAQGLPPDPSHQRGPTMEWGAAGFPWLCCQAAKLGTSQGCTRSRVAQIQILRADSWNRGRSTSPTYLYGTRTVVGNPNLQEFSKNTENRARYSSSSAGVFWQLCRRVSGAVLGCLA